MNNEIAIILSLSIIIFSSPLLSKYLKIPAIPIEIILGSTIVSIGLIKPNEIFTLVAELGFLYLMFLAGLEIDLKKVLKLDKKIVYKGLLYTFLLYFLTTCIVWYLDLANIFIVIIPLISIGLLAALKKEYGDKRWIEFAITIGVIGEIISIIVLTTVSAMLEYGISIKLIKSLGLLLIVFISIMILYKIIHYYIWWNPEIKSKIMPKYDTQEQDIRVSMSVFFLALAIMLYLHLELALGAFIAGVFIATFFSYKIDLPKKLEHFGFGWLVPIFFVWVGTTFDLKSLFLSNLIPISLSVVLFVMFVRIISSIIFINDIGLKNSLLLSLGHSMPLTLIVAVATLALNNNSISEFYYYVFILSAILEVIISMILIKLLSLFKQPLIKDEGF